MTRRSKSHDAAAYKSPDERLAEHLKFYEENYFELFYGGPNRIGSRLYQRRIRNALPETIAGVALELGSRDFELSKSVLSRLAGAELVLGVDLRMPAPGAGQFLAQVAKGFEAVVGDVESIPLSDSSVDVVFHGCLLHHLDHPAKAISEVRRVLRVGGTAVYYLPCQPGLLLRVWQRLFSMRSIRRTASAQGYHDCDPYLLDAVLHKGHYLALKRLIHALHLRDNVTVRAYPIPILSWNLRLFEIISVTKLNH
jgi:SAM-dependent methyltransferase